eukprot:m.225800 g.225800  ORF g.225800 m.225800 type:complete len:366 (-) comp10836_c5_seq20:159-1256(-)
MSSPPRTTAPRLEANLAELDSLIGQLRVDTENKNTTNPPIRSEYSTAQSAPPANSNDSGEYVSTSERAVRVGRDSYSEATEFVPLKGAPKPAPPPAAAAASSSPERSPKPPHTAAAAAASSVDSKDPICDYCRGPIADKLLTAIGKSFHPHHFLCNDCRKPLASVPFFESQGQVFCEADYVRRFGPRCAYCEQSISGKYISAIGKKWHEEHFFCAHCGKSFGDGAGFVERDGRPYCEEDYMRLFSKECVSCHQPIVNDTVSALGSNWHPACFVCQAPGCSRPFPDGSFFELDGKPYCQYHYHEKTGSICHTCNRPIDGKIVIALGHKYHPEHFTCTFCRQQLVQGTFLEHNQSPYCKPCYIKLFG